MLKSHHCLLIFFFVFLLSFDDFSATALNLMKDVEEEDSDDDVKVRSPASLVTKDERKTVTVTEYGQISTVEISEDDDGIRGKHHHYLQFITLEPNSLFLPVLVHADMVFYVHTGSGSLSWVDEDEKKQLNIQRGDIYRLHSGSVFYIRSSLESEREKLRIYAIFTHNNNNANPQKLFIGAYSTLTDLVLGFDKKLLQTAFNVPEDVLEEITRAKRPPAIIHLSPKGRTTTTTTDDESEQTSWKAGIIETLVGGGSGGGGGGGGSDELNKKKKKQKKTTETFNILDKKPDVENCNGWSLAVNKKDFPALKGSDIGVFMVNLTQGSMMGPHWNPRASEIAIVTHGQGMIRVVCSNETSSGCKNMRFRVKEGDVFLVPRFHPMAQMSYNNGSLVFMGFTTMARRNHPQFLAGQSSVLRTLDTDILAMSFNVPNTTIDQLLASQVDSIILECVSCAEEEEKTMQKEIEREREEEEERKRKKEEEKARKREMEEEEAMKREEERKQQEAEARRRQEEEAKRQEEEAKRQEEERQARERREEEEEERKRREEEEAQRREEEEAERTEKERAEKEARREEEEEETSRRREEEREGGGDEGRKRVFKKMWRV